MPKFSNTTGDETPDDVILGFIERAFPRVLAHLPRMTRLTGGVASDIWLIEGEQVFCVKRALKKLKVSADWSAPVERNAKEGRMASHCVGDFAERGTTRARRRHLGRRIRDGVLLTIAFL
jgi:hypothetical protein